MMVVTRRPTRAEYMQAEKLLRLNGWRLSHSIMADTEYATDYGECYLHHSDKAAIYLNCETCHGLMARLTGQKGA